jgi:hypothetical protein
MNHCVVITTILPPSAQVVEHCRRGLRDGTRVIIVADRKTPIADYESLTAEFPNLHLLSLERQHDLFPHLSSALPLNHYARKNVGYAYAIRHGCDAIFDTDDDNVPIAEWPNGQPGERRMRVASRDTATLAFFNIYTLYTTKPLWPRGFPLDWIRDSGGNCEVREGDVDARVAVWQGLVNGDPDVDAIARLTSQDGGDRFYFDDRAMGVVLERGVLCPFNSQNTWWVDRSAFDLLFLPATTTFRTTDILRGYVAQQALWARGARTGFSHATALQARNPHDLMADFASELPLYLHAAKMNQVLAETLRGASGGPGDLVAAYDALAKADLVDPRETAIAEAWLASIS